MLAVSPVIKETNVPVPVPSLVWLSAVVGLIAVLQQTPRAVTAAPPSEVTFPPDVADVVVRSEMGVVVKVGPVAVVVNVRSSP